MKSVAIVGNCYFDEIFDIGEFPNPDDKILASNLNTVLGGGASNTSSGMAALGLDANLFTVMGNDDEAYRLFKEVRNKGINTRYIHHLEGKSGKTIILLDENKSSTKIGYQGVCSDLSKTILFEGLSHPKFDHVHLTSVGYQTIKKSLEFKKGQSYSLDFGAKTLKSSREELLAILNEFELIFVNRGTFKMLFEIPISELHSLKEKYNLIITAGTDGIYGNFRGEVFHQPIYETTVIDTTGAGDAVSAAVIYAYLNKLSPTKILKAGAYAAAIKIRTRGGANGHVSKEEIQNIII